MAVQNNMFQPGAILHEVIVGALRANGTSFQEWCKNNNMSHTSVRQVTFGQSAGPRSKALLNRVIEAAGREVVAAAYRARVDAEAAKLAKMAKVA